jgi:hypothetical protein
VRSSTFAPQFVRDFQALESGMSPADMEIFDALLVAVIEKPNDLQRVQTFYDPHRPSWLVRSDPFVIHYTFDADADEVVFLNLFRRR